MMYSTLFRKIARFIYKRSIYKTTIMERADVSQLETSHLSSLTIVTSHGAFTFDIYEHINNNSSRFVKSFYIEVDVPHNANDLLKNLNNKTVFALKLVVLKLDKELLSDVLLDVALTKFIEYIQYLK